MRSLSARLERGECSELSPVESRSITPQGQRPKATDVSPWYGVYLPIPFIHSHSCAKSPSTAFHHFNPRRSRITHWAASQRSSTVKNATPDSCPWPLPLSALMRTPLAPMRAASAISLD